MSESILERVSRLRETNELCDVIIKVGIDERVFSTHKFLLSIYSSAFKSMLYDSEQDIFEISLPDDDPKDFEVFLKYIYTDKIELNSLDEEISAFRFADKYFIKCMKYKCLSFLNESICFRNVFEIYEKVSNLQDIELQAYCMEIIAHNFSTIISEYDSIKYVPYETILKLVSEEKMILDSEVDMYNAVVKWGKEKYQDHTPQMLREVLKPLLQQVRFLSMSSEEFVKGPCQDEILTRTEQFEILKEMSSKTYKSNNVEDKWRIPRKEKPNKWLSFSPLCRYCSDDDYRFPISLSFRAKQRLHVVGINLRIKYRSPKLCGCDIQCNSLLIITNLKSKQSEMCTETVIIETNYKNNFIRTNKAVFVKQDEIIRIQFKFTRQVDLKKVDFHKDLKLRFRTSIQAICEEFNMPIFDSCMNDYVDDAILYS